MLIGLSALQICVREPRWKRAAEEFATRRNASERSDRRMEIHPPATATEPRTMPNRGHSRNSSDRGAMCRPNPNSIEAIVTYVVKFFHESFRRRASETAQACSDSFMNRRVAGEVPSTMEDRVSKN